MNRTLRTVGSAALLIGCAWFLAGCAVAVPPAIHPISSPSEAVRFLHDRHQETTPYRALLTIRPMTQVGGGISLDALLRVNAVDHFRLQGISPLGGVLFTLESAAGEFHLRLPDRGSVSGPVEMLDALYGRLLPLKVSQLTAVLTPYGDAGGVSDGIFFFQEEGGYYRLTKLRVSPAGPEGPDGVRGWAYPARTWWIEKKTGNLVKMEIHDESPDGTGRKAMIVEYRDFRRPSPDTGTSPETPAGGGVRVPYRIVVKGPDEVPWVELIFQEFHLGRETDADSGT